MGTTVQAPAKLTLTLRVTGVRPDGYHQLEAEMVTVDLVDTLVFDESIRGIEVLAGEPADWASRSEGEPRSGLHSSGGPGPRWLAEVPTGPDNLVVRALQAVDRRSGVRLVKRIPAGAGLGGGSADAAAVLRWAGCDDREKAASLGADVPFCLVGGHASIGGIGDMVRILPPVDHTYTLLLAPFGMDTAAVYRAWDHLHGHGHEPPDPGAAGTNDLEAAATSIEPRLLHWRDAFSDATGLRPRLAGSGSTWFVEGSLEGVGLGDRTSLTVGHEQARLVEVRTVPGFGPLPAVVA